MKRQTIKIVFGQTILPSKLDIPMLAKLSFYKHGDGTSNVSNAQGQYSFIEQDIFQHGFVLPAYPYDPNLLEAIRNYFEPFNIDVYGDTADVFQSHVIGHYLNGVTSDDFVVKMYALMKPGTSEFNALPSTMYNYKRFCWSLYKNEQASTPTNTVIYDTPNILGEAYPGANFTLVNDFQNQVENKATDVAHEIGHLFGLFHWGDRRDPSNIQADGSSVYGDNYRNNHWIPIMGGGPTLLPTFAQWANKGSYTTSQCVQPQDDVLTIGMKAGLRKPPADFTNLSSYRPPNSWWLKRSKEEKHKKQTIFLKKEDGPIFYGLIGYPYDYDIIKILLKKGTYKFKADAFPSTNKMMDCEITHQKCECDLDKDKNNVDMSSDFGGTYESAGESLTFHKSLIENEYTNKSLILDYSAQYFDAETPEMTVTTEYTTLIYLKVRGDYGQPVDDEGNPTENDKSWSRYGAMGEYRLEFDINGVLDAGSDIPSAHCELFYFCKDGANEKVHLFVQDEKDTGSGDPDKLHILETPAIINGESVDKKFLVYGRPIGKDDPGEPGKFYLNILKDGQCMKQEFVVGFGTKD